MTLRNAFGDLATEATLQSLAGAVAEKPACRVDQASATLMYVGEAAPGSAESAGVWAISRVDLSSGVDLRWAGGTSARSHAWTDRASLTYT